jgi:hypothetical protein
MIVDGTLPVPAMAELVDDADYARLLGYPDSRLPAGRVRELAAHSRAWFAREAKPWAFARRLSIKAVAGERVELEDGSVLASPLLARRLANAGATALVAAAVSSGPEVEAGSAALWRGQRPDEAYFLDRFGVAVAEHLAAWTAAGLRSQAHEEGLATLPGYSPGFPGWPLMDQVVLAHCLDRGDRETLPGPLEVLASGAMAPASSLLAVFGLTSSERVAAETWERDKCSWCSLARCAFRRGTEIGSHFAEARHER